MHVVLHHLARLTLSSNSARAVSPPVIESVRCFSHDDKVPARLKTSTDVGEEERLRSSHLHCARRHAVTFSREPLSLCTARGVRPGEILFLRSLGAKTDDCRTGREGHYSSRLAVVEKSGGRTCEREGERETEREGERTQRCGGAAVAARSIPAAAARCGPRTFLRLSSS